MSTAVQRDDPRGAAHRHLGWAEQFETARSVRRVSAVGPGVDDSLYFRDPNGISLELYREELGLFNGESLLR